MSSASSSNIHVERGRRSTLEVEESLEGAGDALLSAEVELNPRPPLLIKVTGYRLLTTSVIASFGTAKAFKSLEGSEATATWIDWITGVILSTALYWLGLYEGLQPPVAVWFFHMDLTQDLFYLSFGIIIATIYCVLVFLVCIFLIKLSINAGLALPSPEDKKFALVVDLFLILLALLLMMVAFVVHLLVGKVVAYVIGLILTLGGGRFKRRVTTFFVKGYQSRFDEQPGVYVLVTVLTSLVIYFFVILNLPLTQWLRKSQSLF